LGFYLALGGSDPKKMTRFNPDKSWKRMDLE
jgi:hypothetical protein